MRPAISTTSSAYFRDGHHPSSAGRPYLDHDAFGVKQSLIRDFIKRDDEQAARLNVTNPFWTVETDFVLALGLGRAL